MRTQIFFRSAPSSLLARCSATKLDAANLISRSPTSLYSTVTSTEDLKPLFLKASQAFPSSLREDKWYLTAVSLLPPRHTLTHH